MIAGIVGRVADIVTITTLLTLLLIGSRLTQTAILHLRYRRAGLAREAAVLAQPLPPDESLPAILVQIPAYNEGKLVERVVGAAAALDWPRDRLQIQLIDQSTGSSAEIARATVAKFREQGHDVVLLWRPERTGFKGGSLQAGLAATGQPFVANFDADYVPAADFLRRCMPPLLADPALGFTQARCGFLNADQNLVTLGQQVILESHYAGEQATRSWAGQILPFNGTCGIWRRAAIEAAGGWHGDTLAEDLDISLRAYLKGWRGMFLLSVVAPGELPDSLSSWERQQRRWNKGFAQTARKLLPIVWRSDLWWDRKFGISLHLGGCAFGPLELLTGVAGVADFLLGTMTYAVVAPLLALAMLQGSVGAIFLSAVSGRMFQLAGAERPRNDRFAITVYTLLMHLRAGGLITLSVVAGALGRASTFERTPKQTDRLQSEP